MDFAKLLRDAFKETIGFVGACAFYLVAPLRWPTRWAERVSDPNTPAAQGYVETRLFFFLSVAAWIVFIHVFLPAPGTATMAGAGGGGIEQQRQQILDTFVQAFAGGMRGAAATGLVLGAVVATAMLDAWLRLRAAGRAVALRMDLVVVALGTMNVYVFIVARVLAYLGQDTLASLLGAVAQTVVEMDWPRPIEMVLAVGSGGVARNVILICLLGGLLSLHIAMSWVLMSPLRMPSETAAESRPPRPVLLAVAGFAAVCVGLIASEAIREGEPRLGEFALVPIEAPGAPRSCVAVMSLMNESERTLLVTRAQFVDLRVRIAMRDEPTRWSAPIEYSAVIRDINGKTDAGVLVRPGETVLITTMAIQPTRPPRLEAAFAAPRAQQFRIPVTFELWLGGGNRAFRTPQVKRRLDQAVDCLPRLLPATSE